jgi:maltooligosyltrehalose trehalohydrolase
VWAPSAKQVCVKIVAPAERVLPMQPIEFGYWQLMVDRVAPGTTYLYQLDGDVERPDPASQSQPEEVHEASQPIDHTTFAWTDREWSNLPLAELRELRGDSGSITSSKSTDS